MRKLVTYPWPILGRLSESTILLILAVVLGLTTGAGVWLFRHGIEFFQSIYREGIVAHVLEGLGPWVIVPLLGLAGLIVGLLVDRFVGVERHHGVAGIMESVALAGGRLRYRRMPIKAALAAFSIGAGASVGPEDPSVQIGANLGSLLGQKLRLSDDRVRLLVAAGAASGIASVFRAPIAGVFFALEVVLGDFSTGAFGVVVLAAVIASVFTTAIEVGPPELGIRIYALGGPQEILLYILLGILIAFVSALFIRVLYWQHDFWHHLSISVPVKTMCAGLVVGLIAVFLPQVMGTGQPTMNLVLNNNDAGLTIGLLILLGVAKIVATTVSLGGGFVGGMFAPSLFVGAVLGSAFGQIVNQIFPREFAANPAAYAMAGMAAAMTGVIRSPITAVLLLFELTNDYNLILPIMLTVAVCLFVTERLAPDGIYHYGLARKGIRLSQGRDIDLMQTITVSEAMSTDPQTVRASLPASQLAAEFAKTNTHGLIVLDDNDLLYGIVTLQDLSRAQEEKDLSLLHVSDLCSRDVVTVTKDDPMANAMQIIGARDLGRLPVVASDNPRQVVGLLRRRDLLRSYDLALKHKLEGAFKFGQAKLAIYSRNHIIEMRVEEGSSLDGILIKDVDWPTGTLVASVNHNGSAVTAHGQTKLQAGDLLTIITKPEFESQLQLLAGSSNHSETH